MALDAHERTRKKEEEDKIKVVESKEDRTTSSTTVVTLGLNTNMINTPIEEFTPLVTILGILSLASEGLGFEGAIVIVGDYYYSHKISAIE
jgi:hypothetical protein